MIVPSEWEQSESQRKAALIARRMLRHVPEVAGPWASYDARQDVLDVAQSAAARLPDYAQESHVVNALKQARATYWRSRRASGAVVLSLEEWREERREARQAEHDIVDTGAQGRKWVDASALRAFCLVAALEVTAPSIVRLGEKLLDGQALTGAERVQLHRWRQAHKGMGAV